MNSDAKHALFLKSLGAVVTINIASQCFTRDDEFTWVRRWGWKADVIDLAARPNGLFINFYVYLPTLGAEEIDGDFTDLAVNGLGLIEGSTDARIRYPNLWFGLSPAAANISMRIVSGLRWFDRFGTPGGCLEYMRGGRGVNASPANRACATYLSSLPSYLEDCCCVRVISVDSPSEGFARLFTIGRTPTSPTAGR